MTRVLLLNPPTFGESPPHIPPLGLAYLAAYLREHGHEVRLLDLDLERDRVTTVPGVVDAWQPEVIGFGALTMQIESVYQLAKQLKARRPETLVVAGGAHPSSLPERTLRESAGAIDAVVQGEGEQPLLELVERRPRGEISGLCYLEHDSFVQAAAPRRMTDLDDLPLPARDLLLVPRYRGWGPLRRTPSTHLIASRGCPFECTYCSESAVFGRHHRRRSPSSVVDEIQHLIGRYGVKEVAFYDDLFTLKRDFVLAVCEELLRRNVTVAWKALSRVDTVDAEMLAVMRRAGCWLLCYGFESGSDAVLRRIRKKQTVAESLTAARLTKQAGIDIFGFFMIGTPDETEEEIFATIDLARTIRPDYFQFSLTRPDPGSRLFALHEAEFTKPQRWSEYYAFAGNGSDIPMMGTRWSVRELIAFRQLATLAMGPRLDALWVPGAIWRSRGAELPPLLSVARRYWQHARDASRRRRGAHG